MRFKLIEGSANDVYDIVGTVLRNRGVQDVQEYLHVNDSHCDGYWCLENMDRAIECFDKHFIEKDKIAILVDCDPDGYTSAAMMYMYIKELSHEDYPVSYMIHDRNKAHGLGKMDEGDFEIPEGTKLLIIPDAGTNDIEQCNALIEQGIDVIILDHHEAEDGVEDNKAIVVNNQMSPNFSNKDYSGAGVTYEFLKALDELYWVELCDDYIDLVALAQISDVMDLRSLPTRFYVNQGLRSVGHPMLRALIEAQDYSMKGKLNPTTVAWYIAPILNALIRIGSYEERELLFRAFIKDYEEFDYKKRSGEIVKESIYERAVRFAKNAKTRQDKMRDKLYALLESKVDYNDKVVIIQEDEAEQGIVGLSAMKLADTIKRPVVVLRDIGNDKLGGSLRNYDNSPIEDLKEVLNGTGLFSAQGHANAAGAEINKYVLGTAKDMLNEQLKDVVYDSSYRCDFVLDFHDMYVGFVQDVDKCDWVWCTGIKEPIIAVTDIHVARKDIHVQGKDRNSIWFEHESIKYVMFKMSEDNKLLKFASDWGEDDDEIIFDAVVTCEMNVYEGIVRPQCTIKDINVKR